MENNMEDVAVAQLQLPPPREHSPVTSDLLRLLKEQEIWIFV